MPQIGWFEILIIVSLAIIIIGPKDFPVMLKKVGSWIGSAGLIDSTSIDASVFGTGKFYKEKQEEKKENIYSNIDEMLIAP